LRTWVYRKRRIRTKDEEREAIAKADPEGERGMRRRRA
jgi:hypothetical protein